MEAFKRATWWRGWTFAAFGALVGSIALFKIVIQPNIDWGPLERILGRAIDGPRAKIERLGDCIVTIDTSTGKTLGKECIPIKMPVPGEAQPSGRLTDADFQKLCADKGGTITKHPKFGWRECFVPDTPDFTTGNSEARYLTSDERTVNIIRPEEGGISQRIGIDFPDLLARYIFTFEDQSVFAQVRRNQRGTGVEFLTEKKAGWQQCEVGFSCSSADSKIWLTVIEARQHSGSSYFVTVQLTAQSSKPEEARRDEPATSVGSTKCKWDGEKFVWCPDPTEAEGRRTCAPHKFVRWERNADGTVHYDCTG